MTAPFRSIEVCRQCEGAGEYFQVQARADGHWMKASPPLNGHDEDACARKYAASGVRECPDCEGKPFCVSYGPDAVDDHLTAMEFWYAIATGHNKAMAKSVDRTGRPWCHVPDDTTPDYILRRLWHATLDNCRCGGRGPGMGGCDACEIWHYTTESK